MTILLNIDENLTREVDFEIYKEKLVHILEVSDLLPEFNFVLHFVIRPDKDVNFLKDSDELNEAYNEHLLFTFGDFVPNVIRQEPDILNVLISF